MTNLTKNQWESLLKTTKFFESFEGHELNEIIKNAKLLHFPMHKYIIKDSEVDFSFYVIVKGHVNVIKKPELSVQSESTVTINAGECFGEMAVITKQPRNNYIIAGSDCYVVKIDGTSIDNIDKNIQLKLYKQFAYNLVKRLQR